MSRPIEHLEEILKTLGPNKVFSDIPSRIAHRMAHSPEILLHEERWADFLPDLVVTPESTEDVVSLVRIANKYLLPLIPQGGRTGSIGSQGRKGAIAVSFHRMDKILDFDEENQLITVEPGVTTDHLGEFLKKKGYVQVEYPAARSPCIGGRVGADGYNRYQFVTGRTKQSVAKIQVVFPDGSVVDLGDQGRRTTKSALGYNLKDLVFGSRGTLCFVTKITLKCYKLPPIETWGYRAFPSPEDMVRALIEVCQDPLTMFSTWRLSGTPNWILRKISKVFAGKEFPHEIGATLDYNVFGDSIIVEHTKEHLNRIFSKHGGFLSDDLPPEEVFGKTAYTNRDIALSRFVSLTQGRSTDGGRGGMWISIDPGIPNSNAVSYISKAAEIQENLGELYPSLSECCEFFPGIAVNVDPHCIFFSGLLVLDMPVFDKNIRDDLMKLYLDHAELVHRLGGSASYVHGFSPRKVEIDMIKEEMGEVGYEIMTKIKRVVDPNNIMNPYVRFSYEEDPILQGALGKR
jgi:glycolate oxidase